VNPSFLRWALLVIALAGGAFVVVWNLLDERRASSGREAASRAAASSEAGQVSAGSTAPQSAAPLAQPLSARLLFAFDRARLDRAETAKLARLAGEIKDAAFERIDAVGHADRIGAEAYNLKLSQRRAEAVKAHLVSLGIDASVVRVSAKGEAEPLSGDDCIDMGPENQQHRALIECLQPDRRVAIAIVGQR
jgi:OmpA-OmpF porin, OOP family